LFTSFTKYTYNDRLKRDNNKYDNNKHNNNAEFRLEHLSSFRS